MTETKQTSTVGIADDAVLNRFTKYVERLGCHLDAPPELVGAFSTEVGAEAYAAFVLHFPTTDHYSNLIHEFDDRYIGSFETWQDMLLQLHAKHLLNKPTRFKVIEAMQGIPMLDLRDWVDQEIRRQIESKFVVVSTTQGTCHVFKR